MKVIGFSSGNVGRLGNTDRMVQAIVNKAGDEGEFVKLADLNYSACKGCVELCAAPQVCQLDDDLKPYYQKLKEADAVVLGASLYFGSVNAGMMSFVERFFGYRHVTIAIAHKPTVLVLGGSGDDHSGAERDFVNRLRAFAIKVVDVVKYSSGIPPCYSCGRHTECVIGGLYMREGKAALTWEVTPESFNRWEDQLRVCEAVDAAAIKLWEATERRRTQGKLPGPGEPGLSTYSTIMELKSDAVATAVLDRQMPGFFSNPDIDKAIGMSVRQLASYVQGALPDEMLDIIDQELARL